MLHCLCRSWQPQNNGCTTLELSGRDDGAEPIKLIIQDHPTWQKPKKRGDKFLKEIVGMKAFRDIAGRVKSIHFKDVGLNNWGDLMQLMKQCGANIEELYLDSCLITRQGALALPEILEIAAKSNDNHHSFCIKDFKLNWRKGCTMNCLDELLRNRTITHLSLQTEKPVLHKFLQFVQNSPHLKQVKLASMKSEYGQITQEEVNNLAINTNNQDQSLDLEMLSIDFPYGEDFPSRLRTDIARILRRARKLKYLEFRGLYKNLPYYFLRDAIHCSDLEVLSIHFGYNKKFSSSLCTDIGHIIRQARKLKCLELWGLKKDLPYDFLRDAIHCSKLKLSESWFDPHIISSLVQGDGVNVAGKLKNLDLGIHPRLAIQLLRLIDLSLLDSFKYSYRGCRRMDELMDALRHQLADKNKGPKRLGISTCYHTLDKLVTKLAPCLAGNNNIEQLELKAKEVGDEGTQRQLMDAMSKMPKLRSWTVREVDYMCLDRKKAPSEHSEMWKEWILDQLQSNCNQIICEIDLPFELGDEIEDMLVFNKWRELFRCYDQLSSGIWSPALGRIKTVDMMFRVLREVPNLFQQVADAASDRDKFRLPRFGVPHHPDCPGCHKRKKQTNSQRKNHCRMGASNE